jgi:hypothetical protein
MIDTVVENLEEAIKQLRNSEEYAKTKSISTREDVLGQCAVEIGCLYGTIDSVRFRLEAVLHLIKLYENGKG